MPLRAHAGSGSHHIIFCIFFSIIINLFSTSKQLHSYTSVNVPRQKRHGFAVWWWETSSTSLRTTPAPARILPSPLGQKLRTVPINCKLTSSDSTISQASITSFHIQRSVWDRTADFSSLLLPIWAHVPPSHLDLPLGRGSALLLGFYAPSWDCQ